MPLDAPVTTAVLPARMPAPEGVGAEEGVVIVRGLPGVFESVVACLVDDNAHEPFAEGFAQPLPHLQRDVLAGGNDVEVVLDIEVQVAVVVEVEDAALHGLVHLIERHDETGFRAHRPADGNGEAVVVAVAVGVGALPEDRLILLEGEVVGVEAMGRREDVAPGELDDGRAHAVAPK